MVNVGCFVFMGCVVGAYVLGRSIAFIGPITALQVTLASGAVFVTCLRQLLQHLATSPTTWYTVAEFRKDMFAWQSDISGTDRVPTDDKTRGSPNEPLSAGTVLAKMAAYLGTWQGIRVVSLVNFVGNLLIFLASESHYRNGDVPNLTKLMTSLSEPRKLWVASLLLSTCGVAVDSVALWSDVRFNRGHIDGYGNGKQSPARLGNFLRDHHFHRSTLLRGCLLFVKLQLVTTGIRCSCDPFYASDSASADFRAYCSHGSSSSDVAFRALLSLQIVVTCGAIAMMEAVYVKPLLEFRTIPGVLRPRLLVWSYAAHSGLLQLVTLFLSAESVFLPQIVQGAACSVSSSAGGVYTIEDSVFLLTQSNMNSGLGLALVVLIIVNNMWRDALDPFVQAVAQAQENSDVGGTATWTVNVKGRYDWENVRGAGTLALLYSVAAAFASCLLSRTTGSIEVWVMVSLVLFSLGAVVVDTPGLMAALIVVLLGPPSITFAALLSKANPKLNKGNDQYTADAFAWLLLVAIVATAAMADPRLSLHPRDAPEKQIGQLSGIISRRKLRSRAALKPSLLAQFEAFDSSDPSKAGAKLTLAEVRPSAFFEQGEEEARTQDPTALSRTGVWGGIYLLLVLLSVAGMGIASVVSSVQDAHRRMAPSDLAELKRLHRNTSAWAIEAGWAKQRRSEFIACTWGGVACERTGSGSLVDAVVGLSLPFTGFQGAPPRDFFATLPDLELVDLSGNFAGHAGPLDADLFSASRGLRALNLTFSPLTGDVPSSLCVGAPRLRTLAYACWQTLPRCLSDACGGGGLACSGGGSPSSLEALLHLPTYADRQSCLAARPIVLAEDTSLVGRTIEVGAFVHAVINGGGHALTGARNASSTKSGFIVVVERGSLELLLITLSSNYRYTVLLGGSLAAGAGVAFVNSQTALYIGARGTATLDNATFTGHVNGTIVNNARKETMITAQFAVFSNNRGVKGACVMNAGTMSLENAFMSGSVAALSGGAVYNFGTLHASRAVFEGNSAAKGGAVYNKGTLRADRATFTNNAALASGGAVYSTKHKAKRCAGSGATCAGNIPEDQAGCSHLKCSAVAVEQ